MGTQIEGRKVAFSGLMGLAEVSAEGGDQKPESRSAATGAAADSGYTGSVEPHAADARTIDSVSRFADCADTKGSQSLAVPYPVGNRTEQVNVCVEGMSRLRFFGTAGRLDRDIKKALAKVVPATVQIKVAGLNRQEWSGSGFILDPADAQKLLPGMAIEPGTYFIHTNNHVAADAKAIMVITADGKQTFRAEVVKSPSGAPLLDEIGDTALLMVKSATLLPTAKTGSRSIVEQGDTVLTAGYPLALPRISVTKGIVSQPEQMTGETLFAIQADAAINPGNSGGPLFTLGGVVVGTNTYTFQGANDLSFANAITEQFDLLRTIWQKGAIVRGDLGVEFTQLSPFERQAPGLPEGMTGAAIADVAVGSAAANAGLKGGDIVSEIRVLEGTRVVRTIPIDYEGEFQHTQVLQIVHALEPGTQVELGVFRREGDASGYAYTAGSVTLPVGSFAPRQQVADQSWGIAAAKNAASEIVVTGCGNGTPGGCSELATGEWVLCGVRARELADFRTQAVGTLADLRDMLRIMRQKGTTQVVLYVRSRTNPAQIRTIILERAIGGLIAKRDEETRAA